MQNFEEIINKAWNNKEQIGSKSDKSIIEAINQTIELTDQGKQEAVNCSILIKDYKIDACYTSNLKRAINTLEIILEIKTAAEI